MGRIADIKVPKGCDRIFVDIDNDKVVITYGSKLNDNEFMCDETGEREQVPCIGDFSIFWHDGMRSKAVCASYVGKDYGEGKYIASTGIRYDHAIKFRNHNQFLSVKGVVDDAY